MPAQFDVGQLNPSWKIKTDGVESRVNDIESATSLTAKEKFLQLSQLIIPKPISVKENPTSENVSIENPDIQKYTSSESKQLFFNVYSEMASEHLKYTGTTEDYINEHQELTARHRFAGICLEQNLPPVAQVILRRNKASNTNENSLSTIDLSHMAMGDSLANALATVLPFVPDVKTLNVRDNRLTDIGIRSLVTHVVTNNTLTSLDLSSNKIDRDAANALASYIKRQDCVLTSLTLTRADLDDAEVVKLSESLKTNVKLTSLDLSHNLIGKSERLNIVQPDLVTGGEALASLLRVNKTIRHLDLSWNSIRLDSAIEFGNAVRYNVGLVTLSLQYNAFANAGTIALASSLEFNSTLKSVDLRHNNIGGEAAYVIASSLSSSSLSSLVLDGNPIGAAGGRALTIATSSISTIDVSMKHCNFDVYDASLFNPEEPSGVYTLDMQVPYERSVALELLRLANTSSNSKFVSIFNNSESKFLPIQTETVEEAATESKVPLTTTTRPSIEQLEKVFSSLDTDCSGSIDITELKAGIEMLGLSDCNTDDDDETLRRLVQKYDLDDTNTIEQEEFNDLVNNELLLKRRTIMNSNKKCTVINADSGEKFEMPSSGVLKIEFVSKTESASVNVTSSSVERVLKLMSGSSDPIKVLDAVSHTTLVLDTIHKAELLLQELVPKSCVDIVAALVIVLPLMQIPSSNHNNIILELVEKCTTPTERMTLQHRLGLGHYGLLVSPNNYCTGHFRLDLSKKEDRIIGARLVTITSSLPIDTSQHQNHLGFRNETLNGAPLTLDSTFFDKKPRFGVLEFDFVNTATDHSSDSRKVSSKRLSQIFARLYLHEFTPISDEEMPARETTSTPSSFQTLKLMQSNCRPSINLPDNHTNPPMVLIADNTTTSVPWTGRRLLFELQHIMATRFLSCKQVAKILQKWPIIYKDLRIEAVVSVFFNRISDLHYFPVLVLPILTEDEVAACYYRLGFLNVWTPLVPDSYFELDLGIFEQRQVATMLVKLSMDEPGENWQEESFRESGAVEDLKDWDFTSAWCKADGTTNVPESGYLKLRYYSGADKGCAPVWPTRRELASQVLIQAPSNEDMFDAFIDAVSRFTK